jgi:hypothetical protein
MPIAARENGYNFVKTSNSRKLLEHDLLIDRQSSQNTVVQIVCLCLLRSTAL